MDAVYFWPDRPALSLLVLWAISALVLWAARDAVFELIERLGKNLEETLGASGRWCKAAAEALHERSRIALLAASGLDIQTKLEKEFHRIESGFSERLGQYSGLHRRLDDLLQSLEQDYQQSGDSPPDVPGWTAAVESIAGIPHADDPNVQVILEGVRKSLDEAQRKALHLYRADTAERHGILDRMRSLWKEVTVLQERMSETLAKALETASRVNGYIDEYSRVRDDDRAAARALSYSWTKTFAVALFVLGVASGCAFASYSLVGPKLAAWLPEASLFGAPLAKVCAVTVVLTHVALGILVMDLLGYTELLPRLAALPNPRRRRLLHATLAGLFALAAVEGWLGGALALVLPPLVAMAAVPLEVVLDSGRHVGIGFAALLVSIVGSFAFALARTARAIANVLPSLYDVYVSIPLRVERWLASPRSPGVVRPHPRPGA